MKRTWIQQTILIWLVLNLCFMPLAIAVEDDTPIYASFGGEIPPDLGAFGKVTPIYGQMSHIPYTVPATSQAVPVSGRTDGVMIFLYISFLFLVAHYLSSRKDLPVHWQSYEKAAVFTFAFAVIAVIGSERAVAQTGWDLVPFAPTTVTSLPDHAPTVCDPADTSGCDDGCWHVTTTSYLSHYGDLEFKLLFNPPGSPAWLSHPNWNATVTIPNPGSGSSINVNEIITEIPIDHINLQDPGSGYETSILCMLPGQYERVFQGAWTESAFETPPLFQCFNDSHFVDYSESELFCESNGCGDKYSTRGVFDPAAGIGCCGDDASDDPDDSVFFCTNPDAPDDGCQMIGTYVHLQFPENRDWDDTGASGNLCCGDDLMADIGQSDCLAKSGNKWCISIDGLIDPTRYNTTSITSWGVFENPISSDALWSSNSPATDNMVTFCDKDNYLNATADSPGIDQVSANLYQLKACTVEEGKNISSNFHGDLTQAINLDSIGVAGPYVVEDGQWKWIEPVSANAYKIFYATCAGYSLLSDQEELFSCTNNPLRDYEITFELPGVPTDASQKSNPYTLTFNDPIIENILCHRVDGTLNSFMISECCGDDACKTCVADNRTIAEEACNNEGSTDHQKVTGNSVVQPKNNEYTALAGRKTAPPEGCACGKFELDLESLSCRIDYESLSKTESPSCTNEGSVSVCFCSNTTDSCDSEVSVFFCANENGEEWKWWSELELYNEYPKSAFDIPNDQLLFAGCSGGTPILDELDWGDAGDHYYCTSEESWVTDINTDEVTCSAASPLTNWTGTRCCGELGEYPEFYADITNACWKSETVDVNDTVKFNLYNSDIDYTELMVVEDQILGCAINETANSSIKPEDLELGVNSEVWEKILYDKRPGEGYGGGSNQPNLANRSDFDLWGEFNWGTVTNNDWMLFLMDNKDGGQLVTDMPYCTTVNLTGDMWYCGYNETWQKQDDPSINLSHLSIAEWDYGGEIGGCCQEGECWNGTYCIDPLDPDIGSLTYPRANPGYICVSGEWQPAIRKYTWDYQEWKFLPNSTYCLVDKFGNLSNNFNTSMFSYSEWESKSDNSNPVWIMDGQYIGDHVCNNGTWTSRTRVIVDKLKEYIEENTLDDYSLHCDVYPLSINNPEYNLSSVTHSDFVECADVANEIPNLVEVAYIWDGTNMDGGAPTIDIPERCYTCRDRTGDKVPCTNSICVLVDKTGSTDQVIFGISLNNPLNSTNFTFLDVVDDVSGCSETSESFESCSSGNAFFNAKMQSLIYSKTSITFGSAASSAWNAFIDFFKTLLAKIFNMFSSKPIPTRPYDYSFISDTKDFKKLYISEQGGTKVEALQEVDLIASGGQDMAYLVASYKGFSADICGSLSEITDNDPNSDCIINGDEHILRATAEGGVSTSSSFFTEENWQELTAKLRLTNASSSGGVSSCNINTQIGSQTCDCAGEYFNGTIGAFGSPTSAICCLDGPCDSACDADTDLCPNACSNPRLSYCGCVNDTCSGTEKVIFPLRNGAGRFIDTPIRCSGDFTIDVRGPRWELDGCVEEQLECKDYPSKTIMPPCPEAFPVDQKEVVYESGIESYFGYYGKVTFESSFDTSILGFPDADYLCCDGGWYYNASIPDAICCIEQQVDWPFNNPAYCNQSNWISCDISQTCGNGVLDNEQEECDFGKTCWNGTACTDDANCTFLPTDCVDRCADGLSCTENSECETYFDPVERFCVERCIDGMRCDSTNTTACDHVIGTDEVCIQRNGSGCSDQCRIEQCPTGADMHIQREGVFTLDCVCENGYANCDGDWTNGCETELGTATDCIWCRDKCADGDVCSNRYFGCQRGTCEIGLGTIGDCIIGNQVC